MFLDFFANGTKDLWIQGLQDLYTQVKFDGVWLDVNEPTGSCNGECHLTKDSSLFLGDDIEQKDLHKWWSSYTIQEEQSSYKLPFIPSTHWNLDNITLSLNATHPSNGLREYDVHSLFGHMQSKITSDVLAERIMPD